MNLKKKRTVCCPSETHIDYKELDKLKLKVYIMLKIIKAGVAMLISNKADQNKKNYQL